MSLSVIDPTWTDVALEERNDPVSVAANDEYLIVFTRDGRIVHVPLNWFPWLTDVNPQERTRCKLIGSMIIWEALNESISMEVVLFGRQGT